MKLEEIEERIVDVIDIFYPIDDKKSGLRVSIELDNGVNIVGDDIPIIDTNKLNEYKQRAKENAIVKAYFYEQYHQKCLKDMAVIPKKELVHMVNIILENEYLLTDEYKDQLLKYKYQNAQEG